MTPAARLSAGIEILDALAVGLEDGQAVEKTLTGWARRNRYAGSGDRAAIRDLVFDILRRKRSCAASGGGNSGRALVLGYLRQSGQEPADFFTGETYAPAPLSRAERAFSPQLSTLPMPVRLDHPDWMTADLTQSLGPDYAEVMHVLRRRAPVFLRVNTARTSLEKARQSLARDEIATRPVPLAGTALEVLEKPRRVAQSHAYRHGLVELQDAASQAVVLALDLPDTGRILDYCAGGGGKSLAMKALSRAEVFAHDIAPQRMCDLPARARRAGVRIAHLPHEQLDNVAPFDLVLCDAPCSGSGAWRRAPAGKWSLTPERLADYVKTQAEILDRASALVAREGTLAYATCSLFKRENLFQAAEFANRNPSFSMQYQRFFTPLEGGDGMFIALFKRK